LLHDGWVVVLVLLLLLRVVVVEGAEVVPVMRDVVVKLDGHRQLSSHFPPPAQPLVPGGSQLSPPDMTPSPHCTLQLVPPALQQARQVAANPRHFLTPARRTLRAVFTHWRLALPLPVQSDLVV
jgi:hypothetical protein